MTMTQTTYDKRAAAELLRDGATFGSVIVSILLQKYGLDLFNKDVLEIYADILEDFDAELPEDGENRLNAMLLCLTTDGFYTDPDIFRAVCTCLLDGDLGDLVAGATEDLSMPELLWAVYEVGLFQDEAIPFAPAVQAVINAEIAQEASEEDLEKSDVLPYYEQFVQDSKYDLLAQLEAIGMDPEELNDLL